MCEECSKEIGEYEDREMPCKHEGCDGTWTWSAENQLAFKRRARTREKPGKMCKRCAQFMRKNEPKILKCKRCGEEMVWPRLHQLHVQLGAWTKPSFCPDCLKLELDTYGSAS
jgi:hypothetical protein